MMINDRKIQITVGNHRRSVNWQPQTLMLSELYERLRVPARGTESMQRYLNLKKAEQDDLKDVGGFVAGGLAGTRRKANAVTGRDVITLDMDNIPPGGTNDILRNVEAIGCGYCVYSTRKPDTPGNRIPSYTAMCELAVADKNVSALMSQEDFADAESIENTANDLAWASQLDRNQNGDYQKTLKNLMLILQNHPDLKGCAQLDLFSSRIYPKHNIKWRRPGDMSPWGDADVTELRLFLERWFKPSKLDVIDAVTGVAERNTYHPIRDYLNSLTWDGIPRLDTLFCDYLGTLDSSYTRAVTRKCITACVARAMNPGCKFDFMTVFIGAQGRFKSSVLYMLAKDWFSDSLGTFNGKEAMESVIGKWVIEIPELNAFERSELNTIKAFVSKQSDYFRAAFAHYTKDNPRQCVFFGTTNNYECLRDTTGGRRFWPLDIDKQPRKKDVFKELAAERDQIWAEAVVRWRLDEPLFLPPELEAIANRIQEDHRETHPWEDTILDFVEKEVPADWDSWDISARMTYWNGVVQNPPATVPRSKICMREIWTEALNGGNITALKPAEARAISSVLNRMPEWEKTGALRFGKCYGVQKGFRRKGVTERNQTA